MPTLREMQAEWNSLVPQAVELGIRRVRHLNDPFESKRYRLDKLTWLRGEIERLLAMRAPATAIHAPAQDLSVFTFGVELEFLMPPGMDSERLAALFRIAGVECTSERYNHTTGHHWKLVTDGSIGDYSRGRELVSPPLRGASGFDQLATACLVLKREGCKVTKKCGLHVHVGAQDWEVDNFKNLFLLYNVAQVHIDQFMAPSRRGNQNDYCQSVRLSPARLATALTLDEVAQACYQVPGRDYTRGSGRYRKLNMMSYWQHGTVEFRHHQGTIEADKALNWVKFCIRMALAARQPAPTALPTLDALFEHVGSPADEADFFRARAAFFAAQIERSARATEARRAGVIAGRATFDTSPSAMLEVEPNPFAEAGADLQTRATTRRAV